MRETLQQIHVSKTIRADLIPKQYAHKFHFNFDKLFGP